MSAEQQGTTPSYNWTILAVDDDVDNLQVISRCLQAHGCRVLKALDGKTALDRAHRERPDLILTEAMMPEMDGFETCRRLKADEILHKIPIIFISAPAGPDETVKAFELGAVDFIAKPIQPEEVLVRVRTHLRLQGRIEHLEERLRRQTENWAGVNQTLKALLDQREMEKRSIEQTMVANLKRYVFPYLDELDRLRIGKDAKSFVRIIRDNIEQLIAPVSQRLSGAYLDLTPMEIKVADLVRQNKRTKFIAKRLNTSPSTVEKHRNKIRKKLNILHKKVNLTTYLNSLC
ncbi:MAG: response regulator [Desulfobacteraceae bacterium]|jgi:DNA-binding response OmpR family regulator/DNA-binding CsgD family transcriptional regulator